MRILPEQMAGLYFTHRRYYAFHEVAVRMKEYAKSPKTLEYWEAVTRHLERLAGKPRIAEASAPNETQAAFH